MIALCLLLEYLFKKYMIISCLFTLSKATSLEEITTYKSCNQREARGNISFQVIKKNNFSFSYLSLFQI